MQVIDFKDLQQLQDHIDTLRALHAELQNDVIPRLCITMKACALHVKNLDPNGERARSLQYQVSDLLEECESLLCSHEQALLPPLNL